MTPFICPVCGKPLNAAGGALRCENGHSHDVARSGYVNLLMSNAEGGKRHGDDRLMVTARQRFLSKGYYQPFLDAIFRLTEGELSTGSLILDAGCGDCWYSAGLLAHLDGAGVCAECVGVDISKDALKIAAKRDERISLAVASVFKLPVVTRSYDLILSAFSPLASEEFARVVRKNGLLMRLVPLEEHLLGLKKAVYQRPYLNPPVAEKPEGFTFLRGEDVRFELTLDSREDIADLFAMTPYYYKTSADDQSKLLALDSLTTEAAVSVRLYRYAGK